MITVHQLSSKDNTPTIEQKKCRSMTRGLQYLTHTRLDIENVVGIVARFQEDVREAHYAAVKRILDNYIRLKIERCGDKKGNMDRR